MRLLGLHLVAFGPFTNVELDFFPEGLHVVYGKNEAGKSTALRAITGLLYGIPKTTPDAHLHRMPDLRVGGRFRLPGGGAIQLVRRKGKDNTLLDREGRPVEESILARLLGGVSEEQFLSTFGLDHESLRRGGVALLLGQGNVGESLFGAAVAGGEVHRLLRTLRADAEALFTPKAHTRPLNEALKALAEAQRRTRVESMSAESIREQQKELEQLLRDRSECEKERQRLHIERSKLERARRALPMIDKRRLLEERRAAMGPVTLLPPGATTARGEQLRILQEAESEISRLRTLVAELDARRAKLVVVESLVRHDEVPFDLANRLGSHRKAADDLPRIRAEVEELDSQARAILRETGRTASLEEAEAWRIDAVTHAAIRKLAIDQSTLALATQETKKWLIERRARRAALLAKRETTPPAPDLAALKKALARAERDGPLEERLAKANAQAHRIERRASAELAALGLGHLELGAAGGLAVPTAEDVDGRARQWAGLEREQEDREKEERELEAQISKLAREIHTLELAGNVPTEHDLSAAREQREETWNDVRRAVFGGAAKERARPSPPERRDLASRYEGQVRRADEISDRLRREAERVGRLAALLAERDIAVSRKGAATEQKNELVGRRESVSGDWRRIWQKAGIEPGPPSEMKGWLLGHGALLRTADELGAILVEQATLRASIDAHRDRLTRLLAMHGVEVDPSSTLVALLDRAQELVDTGQAKALERREIERDLDEIEAQITVLASEENEQATSRRELDEAWRRATAPLGISERRSPEEVTLTIDLLATMFHKIDQAAAARRRAGSIERDADLFSRDVEKVAREHAPDLLGRPAEMAAGEIIERYHQGRADLAKRREIERQLDDAGRMLAAQDERRREAEQSLARLMSNAKVDSLDDLAAAERRSDDARELGRQIASLEGELLELGFGSSGLPAEMAELDADTASARLEDIETELDELRQRASMIDQRIGGVEKGQTELENPQAGAADAALEAEEALAKVREIANRYVRLKVASVVLAREIERYRRENQGPILARASALFRRLTLGSFAELRTDFDEKDQPILIGVRGDAALVRVEAMSDGTRDQLYLALRLATLERISQKDDPMPLIVDDILVHFDDDRARAALEILGELSRSTQVLFFTHHARLVELAREAIPHPWLFIRELSESVPATAVV